MSSTIIRAALAFGNVLGLASTLGACSAELTARVTRAELQQSLEDSCADVPADVAGDILAVLSSIEPLDAAEPQAYGSAACSGVVFEYENPDEEPLHGAWVQASGISRTDSDALSEGRCPERTLQAQYWGYKDKDKAWTKLAEADESARFVMDEEQGVGHCQLDALMLTLQEGVAFEKLRVVARVVQAAETYPMHAIVW